VEIHAEQHLREPRHVEGSLVQIEQPARVGVSQVVIGQPPRPVNSWTALM
jgi:hypothetical protein